MKNVTLLIILVLLISGCGKSETTPPATQTEASEQHHGHELDGWCLEHEIPENICSLCNKKVADDCKKNGDWCKEHDRAESQCFLCDPSRKEKFVAQYEAQYGKKPPQVTK
jgi:uncharacterized protein YceK